MDNVSYTFMLECFSDEIWHSQKYFVQFEATKNNKSIHISTCIAINQRVLNYFCSVNVYELLPRVYNCANFKFHVKILGITDIPVSKKLIDPLNIAKVVALGNIRSMLDNAIFSDFKFIVKGKEFNVHKSVLAAASPVFLKMFTTNMTDCHNNECHIDIFEPEIFRQMLHFIYCGQISKNSDSLYELAHHYELNVLKDLLRQEIHSEMNEDNAMEMYNLAYKYDDDLKELKQAAWEIIKR